MKKSENIKALAAAMSKFQAEVRQPLKDKANPFYKSKFVPLESVVEVISETAQKYGLSFIQYPVSLENKIGIVTIVLHESGEYIETAPIYVTPQKNDPQGAGSAITYLKRYSLSAVFGITSDQDDDGNAASLPQSNSSSESKELDLKGAIVQAASKKGITAKSMYEEISSKLNINKTSDKLTPQETKAIISLLNKQ